MYWAFLAGYIVIGLLHYQREGPCGCGKARWFLVLPPWHGTLNHMIFTIATQVICFFAALLYASDPAVAIWWAGFAVKEIVAIWLHEKDKRKKVAKAIGRVIKDLNGRLRVAPQPT